MSQPGLCKIGFSIVQSCVVFDPHFKGTASRCPFSPEAGEKVADRPDEGDVQALPKREKPPHPALSPKSFAATLLRKAACKLANDLGERGHDRIVHCEQILDKHQRTKLDNFTQPSSALRKKPNPFG